MRANIAHCKVAPLFNRKDATLIDSSDIGRNNSEVSQKNCN